MAGIFFETELKNESDVILEKIKNIEVLLNQMFREDVPFSITDDVVYLGHHIVKEMDAIIIESTEFFKKYSKPNDKKRLPKHYDQILWWYRFGIAKDCFINNTKVGEEYCKTMTRFKSAMRAKYYKRTRKRNKEGHIDIYYFTENEYYKIRLFESVGLLWDVEEERWSIFYSMLCQYYKEMGHTFVSPTYVTKEGFRLGYYVSKLIKRKDRLSQEQKELLQAVEFPYRLLTITGTSFWEQALFYYVKQWNKDAQNRIKVGDYELDVFIPGPPKIAIEYDGFEFHKTPEQYQHDIEKDKYCRNNGIDEIIRIREKGLEEISTATNFFLKSSKYEDFDAIVKEVINYIFLKIDTIKYRDEIIRQYYHLNSLPHYKNFRKLIDYYNLHLEWPTKSKEIELWRLMCLFRNAKKGKLVGIISNSWLDELEKKNFPFDPYNEKFEKFMAHLKRYFETEGDVNKIKSDYIDYYDGTPYPLGSQLNHIKWRHPDNIKGYGTKKGRVLTPDQVSRLNEYHLDWRTNKGTRQVKSETP